VLRRISGLKWVEVTEGCGKPHNEELLFCSIHYSVNIINLIKNRGDDDDAGRVTRMKEKSNTRTVFVRNLMGANWLENLGVDRRIGE
jgi:hypothetical protein